MARKGWGALSSAYRERLEKAGISRQDYEAGASIREGRGHGKTPERPTAANRSEFVGYTRERSRLIRELEQKKERLFGDRPRWHAQRSSRYIRDAVPSMTQLRWAVERATEEDILDAIRESAETFRWLGYH